MYAYNKASETVICHLGQDFSFLCNLIHDKYMMLNYVYGVKLKHSSNQKVLGVAIDNKLSFDERISNICKIANK